MYVSQAAIWDEGEITVLGSLSPGDPELFYSMAMDMNNAGHVVGFSDSYDFEYHGFFWSDQTGMVDLGTLGGERSQAFGVNDADWVTGFATTPDEEAHAVRERAPSREQQVKLLKKASALWMEFGNEEIAEAIKKLAITLQVRDRI